MWKTECTPFLRAEIVTVFRIHHVNVEICALVESLAEAAKEENCISLVLGDHFIYHQVVTYTFEPVMMYMYCDGPYGFN